MNIIKSGVSIIESSLLSVLKRAVILYEDKLSATAQSVLAGISVKYITDYKELNGTCKDCKPNDIIIVNDISRITTEPVCIVDTFIVFEDIDGMMKLYRTGKVYSFQELCNNWIETTVIERLVRLSEYDRPLPIEMPNDISFNKNEPMDLGTCTMVMVRPDVIITKGLRPTQFSFGIVEISQ